AAGVRRHERRRRQAEDRLAEAEANLARVLDIVGELRPQVRRLAAQAEQQLARRDAAAELAQALITAAQVRWMAAAGEVGTVHGRLASSRNAADGALAALRAAEEELASLSLVLGDRSVAARGARAELDVMRMRVTELRLADGRLSAELGLAERESARLDGERRSLEMRVAEARRVLATPLPPADAAADDAVVELDAALAAALSEVSRFDELPGSSGADAASIRRARATREAEGEMLRRRAAEAAAQSAAALASLVAARATDARTAAALQGAHQARVAAETAEHAAATAVEAARGALEATDGRRASLAGRAAAAAARLETAQEQLAGLDALLAALSEGGITVAARRRGGRLVADGLEVEPAHRAAVEAVLGEVMRAATVTAQHVVALRTEHGQLLLDAGTAPPSGGPEAAIVTLAVAARGGALADTVRRDPGGHVSRLLRPCVWVPDLEAALGLRGSLPFGWRAATLAGEIVGADGVVVLGRPQGLLERRAEHKRLVAEVVGLGEAATTAARSAEVGLAAASTARAAHGATLATLETARRDHATAQEAERVAARAAEQAARELAWEAAQHQRLEQVASRAGTAADSAPVTGVDAASAASAPDDDNAAAAWRARVAELRARRAQLATAAAQDRQTRDASADAHRRAEIALALDGDRSAVLDRDAAALVGTVSAMRNDRAAIVVELAEARDAEQHAAQAVQELEAAESGERTRLLALERQAAAIRERLRQAEDRSRAAEVAESAARLGLDTIREGLLVELAALGPSGLSALRAAAGLEPEAEPELDADDATLAARLEQVIDVAAASWAPPAATAVPTADAEEAPTPARLAVMRRRYHELGASNPFAVEEYAAVRARLTDLDGQQADLDGAIAATRQLIGELSERINDQFRTTFAALESAFARRFTELFGGGEASLLLTDPDELAQTGIEIMARPPGKKRQPLAALSGGERALTAVALLFAMLEVRPVPFCVLDEVDAALDEANVERFVGALRDLAETTQCIVITHNRGTIEAADALYGVTIGDDAVSRVISLRLADAGELAAVAG
ncbi:MAG: AAA family ATPase, partial [Candidatus Limnocylindrales bacterium]